MILQKFERNESGRDFVVGDIHGCFDELMALLDSAGFNREVDRLFSVGDLGDRGRDSERVFYLTNEPWFFAVKGNHEDMVRYDDTEAAHVSLLNGGGWFWSLVGAERQAIRDIVSTLPVAIEIDSPAGKVGIVHAEVPGDDWGNFSTEWIERDHLEHHAMWSRKLIKMRSNESFIREWMGVANIDLVFVGHTPVEEPTTIGNVSYIDTGAVFNRKLTMVELDEHRTIYQVAVTDSGYSRKRK